MKFGGKIMKIIYDGFSSKITYDKDLRICTKKMKNDNLTKDQFNLYKNLIQSNPHCINIYDRIDSCTYTMEYIPDIVGTARTYFEDNNSTKQEYIKLFKLITSVWTSAMNASAKLPENQFFVHTDFKFDNIVVCKNKKDELSFKLIDCESWTIVDGYHGVDTFYYSMFKMSLLMQRL
jgi:hypothetical protein